MSHVTDLVVYGAGGHGLVVADAARASGWQVAGFLDDGRKPGTRTDDGGLILAIDQLDPSQTSFIIAIGDNPTRARLFESMRERGWRSAAVIHPTAVVSRTARLGKAVYIGARAVVNPMAHIDDGAIINTGAIVEHHCTIGAFAHLGPGAVLGGSVRLGQQALVGVGARVRPALRIGDKAVIGVGAAVVEPVAAEATVIGVPARARD